MPSIFVVNTLYIIIATADVPIPNAVLYKASEIPTDNCSAAAPPPSPPAAARCVPPRSVHSRAVRASSQQGAWLLPCALRVHAAAPATAQELRFLPIDEAAGNPDWQAYKHRLLVALDEKNRKALLGAIDPNVN